MLIPKASVFGRIQKCISWVEQGLERLHFRLSDDF